RDGPKQLVLRDKDPFDYAKAERIFPSSEKLVIEFSITPMQNDHGQLDIEVLDKKGNAFVRFTLDSTGIFRSKAGARYKTITRYESGKNYDIQVSLDAKARFYTVHVNGKE